MHRIAFEYPVAGADELWAGLLAGTVRTSALVLGQPADVQRRIREAFNRTLARYRRADGLQIPVSVKLAAGRKAG